MNTNSGGGAFSGLLVAVLGILAALGGIFAVYHVFLVFKRNGNDGKSDTEQAGKEYMNVGMNYGMFLAALALVGVFGPTLADMLKSFFSGVF